MKEAAITQSPHAFVPKEHLTDQEREELYRTRLDESFRPYTVIDVITKVYHRSFEDDLKTYIGEHPEEFKTSSDDWSVAHIWVNELKILRPESVFFQEIEDFKVDIAIEAHIKLEETRRISAAFRKSYKLTLKLRLRYTFDFRPCHLECRFEGAVLDEKLSIQALKSSNLPVDKYLIPVMAAKDYEHLGRFIRTVYLPDTLDKDAPLDPEDWIREMGLTRLYGSFPENGALGEYFFSFGTSDILVEETGEILRGDIDPGTIILNQDVRDSRSMKNSTLAHEGTHHYLGRFFFALQKTHGHAYCSYMCKRSSNSARQDRTSPMERMEIQANTFPRYLMIPEKHGKAHAEHLLAYYGGLRNLANMRRLVDDMAEYYGTTKTMARSRLMDFGYNEVRGILRTANGNLVPSYLSTLSEHETYTINEADALKEYLRNADFRRILNTGDYLYVPENGVYCRNDRKFLFFDQNRRPHLRRYALEHMGECCLAFREEFTNIIERFVNGVLLKTPGQGRGRKQIKYVGANGESVTTDAGLQLRKQMEMQMREEAKFEKNFNDLTVELMDVRKITVGALAEATGLSDHTIKNMRNKPEIMFPIQEIVAVCIALHLPPETSRKYIRVSPSKLLNTVDMKLYEYALSQWYLQPLPVVNRMLVEAGAQPLTNLVDGYDENGLRIAN